MSAEIESRIKIVEENLLYDSVYVNKGYKRASLLERMKYYNVPGVSIAVINNFKIEWVKGYGTKEIDYINAVDESTLFQAASISKSVFSAAVMHLVKKGILNIDEDVNTYGMAKNTSLLETMERYIHLWIAWNGRENTLLFQIP